MGLRPNSGGLQDASRRNGGDHGDHARGTDGSRNRRETAVPQARDERVTDELEVHRLELAMQNAELLETQVELRAALERYRDLYDFAPIGYVTLDGRSIVRKSNLTAVLRLGVRRANLEGTSFARMVADDDLPQFWRHMREVLASRETRQCELRLVTPSAEQAWMRLHSISDGEPAAEPAVRVAMIDITAHKLATDALERSRLELERNVATRTAELRAVNASLEHELAARQRVERELRTSHGRLRALASEAAQVEDRERKRLAADLHDGLGQMLTLARMKLDAQIPAAGSEAALREVAALLSDVHERAESLMFQLSPPLLHDVGLRAACEWLAEEVTRLYGLGVHVEADEEHRWDDEAVAITLYRAVRELLLNVAEHAKAARAHVSFRMRDGALRIGVEDDGEGFGAGARKAFGLSNLEERLNHLGGRLDIATAPGRGTTATITLPLAPLTPLD